MKKSSWICPIVAGILLLASCAPEHSELSCPVPDGTSCERLSEVYDRTASQPAPELAKVDPDSTPATIHLQLPTTAISSQSRILQPHLVPSRYLRIWIAPWQDPDGDLRDQQFVYMIMSAPSWHLPADQPLPSAVAP